MNVKLVHINLLTKLSFLALGVLASCVTAHNSNPPLVLDHPTPVIDASPASNALPTTLQTENIIGAPGNFPKTLNFDWPVTDARLTRGFRFGRRPHWGLDLASKKGTKIMAAEKGYVVYTGHGFHGYGKLVVIEHNEQWATLYSHLDKITVREGQLVQRGETVGAMGRTGRASGVHLHFEMRENRQPVNPLALLPEGYGRAPGRDSTGPGDD